MDAQIQKNNIIRWVQGLNDTQILSALQNIAESHLEMDSKGDMPEGERSSILKGHQEYLEGKGIPDKEAKDILRSKFGF